MFQQTGTSVRGAAASSAPAALCLPRGARDETVGTRAPGLPLAVREAEEMPDKIDHVADEPVVRGPDVESERRSVKWPSVHRIP